MAGLAPLLVIVSGPPGSGKTTLAHALARAVPCPAICRDEIKEGLVHAAGREVAPEGDDPLHRPANDAFFATLRLLNGAGVTVVAEAAFQDRLWRPGLERWADASALRIVHCVADPDVARERIARRLSAAGGVRPAHGDAALLRALDAGTGWAASFRPISVDAPAIRVDTGDGYDPGLPEILAFVTRR